MKIFTLFAILATPVLIFALLQKEARLSEADFYASRTFPANEAHPCATEVRFRVVTETLEFPGELLNYIQRQNLPDCGTQLLDGVNFFTSI